MSPAASNLLGDLSEIVRCLPVGVLTFGDDGEIGLANPLVRQLLGPVNADPAFTNIFAALRPLAPDLSGKVAAFTGDSGIIVDQRPLQGVAGRQALTLSLSVSRLRPGLHLAVVRDVTRLTDMIAFAFAAADVLIDLDADGTVRWAGGAVRTLFGLQPQEAVGRPVATLVAPRDRDALARALAVIAARGRLAPLLLRLANPSESRCVVSGMMLDGPAVRILLTLSPPPGDGVAASPTIRGGRDFRIEADNWVRSGHAGLLGLLDIKGWDAAASGLDDTRRGALKHMMGRLAVEAGGEDVVLGEIGEGRFGVLGGHGTDMARLGAALSDLVGSFAGGQPAEVRHSAIALDAGLLSISQSVQALRLALSRFGTAGLEEVEACGLGEGLSGIIAHVSSRKRSLAAAIAEGRFRLTYQPVVGLRDRRLHHYEALLRLPPDMQDGMGTQEFVTMAEAVGLSEDLDVAVLRQAVAAMRQTGASVAVNVSGRSVVSPSFIRKLLAEAVGLPPRQLLIEITETAEIEDMAAAALQIGRLRTAQIGVCLDDFGAGHASFRYVRDLRVDYLKIDGAFVRAAGQGAQGRSFVRAMRDLAESAGARTIAEMVETEADLAVMADLGVHYGQGFLLGRPGPILRPARRDEACL